MDYEILYKNALERAKKFIEENPLVQNLNTWIKETFPELKEPEDEKVRKALIEMVHDTTGDELWVDYNVHKEEALAWLEKQGKSSDQRHYWTEEEIEPIISDYLRGAEHYGGMIARLRCLKPKSLEKQGETYTKRDVDNAWLEGMASAKRELEKQSEQKTDWSEEDEKMVYNILTPLATRYPFDIYQPMYNWLKSLKDRVQPQNTWKPSDEQMADLWNMLCECRPADHQLLQDIYYGLKKLRENNL